MTFTQKNLRLSSPIGIFLLGWLSFLAGSQRAFAIEVDSGSISGLSMSHGGDASDPLDASFIFSNPAHVSFLKKEVVLTGAYSGETAHFSGGQLTPFLSTKGYTASEYAKGTPTSVGDFSGSHAHIALFSTLPLNPKWAMGLAITSPWSSQISTGDWVGKYYVTDFQLDTINFSPLLSYQLLPSLSLGGGIQVQYLQVDMGYDLDFGALPALDEYNTLNRSSIIENSVHYSGTADGSLDYKANSIDGGLLLGFLWQPHSSLRWGGSFRSTVLHKTEGDLTITHPTGQDALAATFKPYQSGSGSLRLQTPAVWLTGVSWQPRESTTVSLSYQYMDATKSFQQEDLESSALPASQSLFFHGKSRHRGSIGGRYTWRAWQFRGGASMQTTMFPETETLLLWDSHRYEVNTGVGYTWRERYRVDAAYAYKLPNSTSLQTEAQRVQTEAKGLLTGKTNWSTQTVGLQFKVGF